MGSKPKTPTPGDAGFGSGIVPGTGSGFGGDDRYAVVNTGGVQAAPVDHSRLDTLGINMPQIPGQQPAIPNTYGQQPSGMNPMTQLYGQPVGGYDPNMQARPQVQPIANQHMPNLGYQKPAPDYRQMRIDSILGATRNGRRGY